MSGIHKKFAALLLICTSASASAHHSIAMFDMARTVEVSGTVAKFDWSNPHVFLYVYVPKPEGGFQLYTFEGASPGNMMRHGGSPDMIKAGEKLVVHYHPLKDGRPGGSFNKVIHADGTQHGGDGGGPGPSPRNSDREAGPR